METLRMESLNVNDLIHAPWNPRNEDELSPDNPSMVELIESVRAGGITQSLAVWDRGDGEPLMVIAGNRRLEAAKAAGLSKVPAIVFSGITEARAHEITRTENEIRSGVDPIMDAQLIERMLSKGLSQKEVAAHFAMSESMVCRRTKLLGLIDDVRMIAQQKHNIDTKTLEQIALYPAETQKKCLPDIKRAAGRDGETVRWSMIKYYFDRMTRNLDGAKFDTSACVGCPLRTGAQPDLWNDMPEDGKLGDCLKCDCYEKKFREYISSEVYKKVGPGVAIVDAKVEGYDRWELSSREEFSGRKSKKTPVAWWFYEQYGDELKIMWGPSLESFKKTMEDEERRRAENEAANREKTDAERKMRAALEKERESLCSEWNGKFRAVNEHWCHLDSDDIEKLAKTGIAGSAFKGKARDFICEAVSGWFRYTASGEVQIEFLMAFPKFAALLKVKPEDLKACSDANAAISKFDKNNRIN